ncbi:MAG: hypothetical protein AAB658_14120, partial [Chloroflexota bacterium]
AGTKLTETCPSRRTESDGGLAGSQLPVSSEGGDPMLEQNAQPLSLSNLLRPEVRANPYPFYAQLRSQDPVHWDEAMGSLEAGKP